MLKMCLIGAGRIGAIHAGNVAAHPDSRLLYVVDSNREAAVGLAQRHGAEALTSVDQALASKEVGGVLIASSTNTHVDYLIEAARAGKAIFCEKPIDLDLARADGAIAEIEKAGVPCLIAFNRRFDPSFRKLHDDLRAGVIGELETVIVTSRDPGPPPLDYVKVSGGLFRDMMIHDFDLARWL
ncbi:MAG: Gfo/Idh/MocA family oxidoreductase, partial [Deltaproteobacteria bacterium]|nr:Gfo/Idh/MocA family oxidoreductase [Deltaproteobacteria bacterium]